MTQPFEADDEATPLTPEERNELVPTHIALRSELNELEQKNIAEADRWAFGRKRNVLAEGSLRGLHRRMFNHVRRWAIGSTARLWNEPGDQSRPAPTCRGMPRQAKTLNVPRLGPTIRA